MTLPFKTLAEPEVPLIGGLIPMPKHGSTTVAEEIAFRKYAKSVDREQLTDIEADIDFKVQIATIILRSRVDKSWTVEKTVSDKWKFSSGEIPGTTILLEALVEFFLNEQRRWKDATPTEEEPAQKKK